MITGDVNLDRVAPRSPPAATRMAIPRSVVLGSLYPTQSHDRSSDHVCREPVQQDSLDAGSTVLHVLVCGIGAKSPQHNCRREKFDGAVSAERKQRGATLPPCCKQGNHSLNTHQAIVIACTCRMRRTASGLAICNTKAIWVVSLSHHGGYGSRRPARGRLRSRVRFVPDTQVH